ncbi:hypothetical protein Syun_021220 [Stephania yunnanensis]|uniref:Mucin-like protein n=1 Tax=Stephania yunnanensis TaxID=152371 RepID=A0AAP0IG69_9MAGN
MLTLKRLILTTHFHLLSQLAVKPQQKNSNPLTLLLLFKHFSSTNNGGDDKWNDAWESAWLPEDLSAKNRAPWETDVNFSSNEEAAAVVLPSNVDVETKAFVEEMNDNWNERRMRSPKPQPEQRQQRGQQSKSDGSLYSVENIKKDYRLKKQRIHAGMWMKEMEKQEEAKLGGGGEDDIERLLDSYSEIFDSSNNYLSNSKISSTTDLKMKPDGWETLSESQDGNIWEMSQREEDILVQEFERRMAFSKFQIATFIKSHIFSRRRPLDGWQYMIEVLGPNARKEKGSVSRLPSLTYSSTEPFREDRTATSPNPTPSRRK